MVVTILGAVILTPSDGGETARDELSNTRESCQNGITYGHLNTGAITPVHGRSCNEVKAHERRSRCDVPVQKTFLTPILWGDGDRCQALVRDPVRASLRRRQHVTTQMRYDFNDSIGTFECSLECYTKVERYRGRCLSTLLGDFVLYDGEERRGERKRMSLMK